MWPNCVDAQRIAVEASADRRMPVSCLRRSTSNGGWRYDARINPHVSSAVIVARLTPVLDETLAGIPGDVQ